jgi:hypothetical protein
LVVTKASAGRRKRRFERRGGRPTGSYKSLLKDPQRFSIATWLTLAPIYGPHVAARAAAVWIEERTPITLEFVKGLLRMISANYKEPTSAKASKSRGPRRLRQPARNLDGYASQLADKARLMTARSTEHEFAWLTQSSGALFALMKFIMEGNTVGADQAIKLLRHAGWGEIIDRIGGRLAPDVRAKFPPFEGPLTAQAQRLLAALRARKPT